MDNPDVFGGSPAMIQRRVILQRDENGYGLTVSGDNPVKIQSVKDNGAAFKAGVHKEDIIVKVNGTLVTSSNHGEVVKLIRAAGSYVALTLLGRQTNQGGQRPSSPSQSVSPLYQTNTEMDGSRKSVTYPQPVTVDTEMKYKVERFQTMKRMLEEEKNLQDEMMEQYKKAPTERLKKDLSGIRTRVKMLESQVYSAAIESRIVQKNFDAMNENMSSNNEIRKADWLPGGANHTRQRSSPDTEIYSTQQPSYDDTSNNRRGSAELKRHNSDAQAKQDQKQKHLRREIDAKARKQKEFEGLGRSQSLPLSPGSEEDEFLARSRSSTDHMEDIAEQEANRDRKEDIFSPANMNLYAPQPSNYSDQFRPASTVDGLNKQKEIISMEDEFASDGENHLTQDCQDGEQSLFAIPQKFDEHGPFDSLHELEKKPAHMAVFLHYLLSNRDPASFFFYFVTESYKTGSLKEMRKWVYEIFSSFLTPNAPLRARVSDDTAETIETIISKEKESNNEEIMRTIFTTAQNEAALEVQELLADFRRNRALGLGSLFGDQVLSTEHMDRSQEIKIVEQQLTPHLERLLKAFPSDAQADRDIALASALSTFMKQVGVKGQGNSAIDRCASFTNRDQQRRPRWPKSTKKHIKGHQFVETHYTTTVFCTVCTGLIWGIGYQGMKCQDCEINIHKTGLCGDKTEECQGKKSNKKTMIPARPRFPGGKKEKGRESVVEQPPSTIQALPASINSHVVGPMRIEDEEIGDMKESGIVTKMLQQWPDSKSQSQLSVRTDSGISTLADESLLSEQYDKRKSGLSRSESLKTQNEQKREKKRSERRSRSNHENRNTVFIDDVDVDPATLETALVRPTQPAAGSDSSLSNKSRESLTSLYNDDSDMEAENDTPNWQKRVDKDIVKKLRPKEVKRQEIINELFHTEKTHVRNLKVLKKVFYEPWNSFNDRFAEDIIGEVFPNLDEMLQVHSELNMQMKKERKTIHVIQGVGDIFLNRFDGVKGEEMRSVCATFCGNQQHALELLKRRIKKDTRLANFMNEAEASPLCRRLPLTGIISTAYQRLTKYPLLIENLLKYTQSKDADYAKLERARECCKALLAYVNQAVTERGNYHRLQEICTKLDSSPYDKTLKENKELEKLELPNETLLYELSVQWKVHRTKTLEMHALILEEFVVLLQKQDEKLVLKYHSTSTQAPGPLPSQQQQESRERRNTHSPIIKLSNLLCRPVATNKKGFFLVSTSVQGPQIYELVTSSTSERQQWIDAIKNAQESLRRKPSRRHGKTIKHPSKRIGHQITEEIREISSVVKKVSESDPPQVENVVMPTPEVVTTPGPTTPPSVECDKDTSLSEAVNRIKNLPEDASAEEIASEFNVLFSRLLPVFKEKLKSEPEALEGATLIPDQVQKLQDRLHSKREIETQIRDHRIRDLESEVQFNLQMTQQLQQELSAAQHELYSLQTASIVPVNSEPFADSYESLPSTDLDKPEANGARNKRFSSSADSNSSATDSEEGIVDGNELDDSPTMVDEGQERLSTSGDSMGMAPVVLESALQPTVINVQAQRASPVINTQLQTLQSVGEGYVTEMVEVRRSEVVQTAQSIQAEVKVMGEFVEKVEDERSQDVDIEPISLKLENMDIAEHNLDLDTNTEGSDNKCRTSEIITDAEEDNEINEPEYEDCLDVEVPFVADSSASVEASAGSSSTSDMPSSYQMPESPPEERQVNPQPQGILSASSDVHASDTSQDSGSLASNSSSGGSSRPVSMASADSASDVTDSRGDGTSNQDNKQDDNIVTKQEDSPCDQLSDSEGDQKIVNREEEEMIGQEQALLTDKSEDLKDQNSNHKVDENSEPSPMQDEELNDLSKQEGTEKTEDIKRLSGGLNIEFTLVEVEEQVEDVEANNSGEKSAPDKSESLSDDKTEKREEGDNEETLVDAEGIPLDCSLGYERDQSLTIVENPLLSQQMDSFELDIPYIGEVEEEQSTSRRGELKFPVDIDEAFADLGIQENKETKNGLNKGQMNDGKVGPEGDMAHSSVGTDPFRHVDQSYSGDQNKSQPRKVKEQYDNVPESDSDDGYEKIA